MPVSRVRCNDAGTQTIALHDMFLFAGGGKGRVECMHCVVHDGTVSLQRVCQWQRDGHIDCRVMALDAFQHNGACICDVM